MREVVEPLTRYLERTQSFVVGLGGAAGSGKSTLAAALAAVMPGDVLTMSLDDFYLPRDERLARGLEFRAQPGSHDIGLLLRVLSDLRAGRFPVELPRFSGALDDRTEPTVMESRPGVVLLEGWLLGYTGDGYGSILDLVDVLVFIETEASVARERRFMREEQLREAGGGLSEGEMQRFWDEVLSPGITSWVADAKRAAGVILEVGADQRLRSVHLRPDVRLPAW